MAAEKTSEKTKKKISQAMRIAWKKRKRISKGLAVQFGSNGSILTSIGQTTQALRRLTLEEISSIAGKKGLESKLEELLNLATNLKQVVKTRSSSRKG